VTTHAIKPPTTHAIAKKIGVHVDLERSTIARYNYHGKHHDSYTLRVLMPKVRWLNVRRAYRAVRAVKKSTL